MAEGLTLYTCHLKDGGPKVHPCRKAHDALDEAGLKHQLVEFDQGRPFGFGTKGKRPELKEMSGQEKLPVLQLPDGSTVNGGGKIAKWAKENTPGA